MNNLYLFELINAAPHPEPWQLWLAIASAQWLIYLLPVGIAWAWLRGEGLMRLDLLELLAAALLALGLAQVVAHVWPQPRPFVLHLGTQLMAHANDASMPSDHVTLFWGLALSALINERLGVWGFPLLTAGLAVGWAQVFLGVHFPSDILAALPVSALGAVIAHALRPVTKPHAVRLLALHDQWLAHLRSRLSLFRKS